MKCPHCESNKVNALTKFPLLITTIGFSLLVSFFGLFLVPYYFLGAMVFVAGLLIAFAAPATGRCHDCHKSFAYIQPEDADDSTADDSFNHAHPIHQMGR